MILRFRITLERLAVQIVASFFFLKPDFVLSLLLSSAMKGGRKNLKRAAEQEAFALQGDQSIMQVVSLRGSNLIEVMDAGGKKSLAIFPAKVQKSMWIKRGSFVTIDGKGRDLALESGSKVACMVSQVLFHEQVRVLQKSPDWPDIFKTATPDNGHPQPQAPISEIAEELNSSDDDELPPLEANLNRVRPMEFRSDSESGSDTEPELVSEMASIVL